MTQAANRPSGITLAPGSSLANKTGAWRSERPVYRSLLPPCNDACPAGEDIQGWLRLVQEGQFEQAWQLLVTDNPFPAVLGRVCYHRCQTACNRARLDQAVGINAVERWLGDEAIRRNWTVPVTSATSGRRVLVVGAGPAGLSAAYHLRLRGHEVVVRDAAGQAGGMLRYGIPAYRLPPAVLDAEIERIAALGVRLELDQMVTDLVAAQQDFDAIFLAVGAQSGKGMRLPTDGSVRIADALTVLREVALAAPPKLGQRVIVYGGGNTAVDAARTARRLGADDVLIVYRRTRERMPAHDSEVLEATEEGIRFRWLSTITTAEGGTVTVEQMELDATGFPQPTGQTDQLGADTVILAIGQEVDSSLVEQVPEIEVENGVIQVGPDLMTSRPGVFAGGDTVPAERTVTTAVGHGKRAACHIDDWLRGISPERPVRPPVAGFDVLNPWYYPAAPAADQPRLPAARRMSTFDEVVCGLAGPAARSEAQRCLSCGNCFECDNCYGMCPDNAISKLGAGKGFVINLDYCKGCGICAQECPAGAIEIVPEEA